MKVRSGRTAYVIGSGPNGLTAAIIMARAGVPTTILEAQPTVGGGTRSADLTLPGFVHDICSAVHPLAASSPVFNSFPLAAHGLQWIQPPVPLAHPLEDGSCGVAYLSLEQTAECLGRDARVYRRIMKPFVRRWNHLVREILAPPHLPRHPLLLARFGLAAAWPASVAARALFRTEAARALFGGMAAHAIMPLEMPGSAAFGWMLSLAAHAVGWPIPRGGSQRIASALSSYFESLGGRIVANTAVRSLDELDDAGMVLCDITPRQLLAIAGSRLPKSYCRKLEKFRYGPGAYKMDWALKKPIPWKSSACARAGTLHLGGTLDEIAASERAPWEGAIANHPFVLLAQPSLFDSTRAPAGQHTAWGYCHVPNGSTADMSEQIESQVERFAPGFRATILARSTRNTAQMQQHNENLVGGDINGGAQDLRQLFLRPTRSLYWTPIKGLYLCSSSTPPGGGVHGMCGYYAARIALQEAGIKYYPSRIRQPEITTA